MNVILKKVLIVIFSVILLIVFFFLYEEYESLKDDNVVGAYEKYRKIQFNLETGKSTPLYKKDGKFYIKEDFTCNDTVVRRHVSNNYGVITLIRSLGLATDNGVNYRTVPSKAIICRALHANSSLSYHLAWKNNGTTYTKDVTREVSNPR